VPNIDTVLSSQRRNYSTNYVESFSNPDSYLGDYQPLLRYYQYDCLGALLPFAVTIIRFFLPFR
jgi:hypothetical protein